MEHEILDRICQYIFRVPALRTEFPYFFTDALGARVFYANWFQATCNVWLICHKMHLDDGTKSESACSCIPLKKQQQISMKAKQISLFLLCSDEIHFHWSLPSSWWMRPHGGLKLVKTRLSCGRSWLSPLSNTSPLLWLPLTKIPQKIELKGFFQPS